MCAKHGTDFLEYKCRYCCSVAVFFCFGTTHFCNACHNDVNRVLNIPKQELPQCPAGPRGKHLGGTECPLHVKHPPTGEEYTLGCGICRNKMMMIVAVLNLSLSALLFVNLTLTLFTGKSVYVNYYCLQ
ncbi:E3 ubiquitin-protein ligase MYCBP2-like isoform X8 [Leptotrombidium deliense]|uniref:E3 ubiquitin-protein ligase MYCBP2-like isoform X8 n=1 Tax=Leptotrombidium deliense TaxID=299467 RepID=A0A443S5I6_9ACAR|nr:E3 ubiquitin-protein ligase MYCBP2-like isoform X8 [Leptotrombidium deliense]